MASEHVSMMGQELLERMEGDRFGELHIRLDENTGLRAIIAIHSTRLGPALGGARCIPYPSFDAALVDAARLARGMSYKAAVVGTTTGEHPRGDPSPLTAFGVLRGIQDAVHHALGRDDLEGVHVLVQGAGYVGCHLCRELAQRGARITVSDIDERAVRRVVEVCGAGEAAASDARRLADRGIVYAPDYVINAGGLMHVSARHGGSVRGQVAGIYDTLLDIFQRAAADNRTTAEVADAIAESILYDNQEVSRSATE